MRYRINPQMYANAATTAANSNSSSSTSRWRTHTHRWQVHRKSWRRRRRRRRRHNAKYTGNAYAREKYATTSRAVRAKLHSRVAAVAATTKPHVGGATTTEPIVCVFDVRRFFKVMQIKLRTNRIIHTQHIHLVNVSMFSGCALGCYAIRDTTHTHTLKSVYARTVE